MSRRDAPLGWGDDLKQQAKAAGIRPTSARPTSARLPAARPLSAKTSGLGGASDAVKTHNEAEQRGDLQAKLRALRVDGKADTQDGGLRSSVALDVSGVLEDEVQSLVQKAKFTKKELDRAEELEKAFARENIANRERVKLVEHLQLAEERAERAEEALARARSEKRDAGLADEVSQARAREQVAVREKGAALDRERQAKEALEAAEALNAKATKQDGKNRKEILDLKQQLREQKVALDKVEERAKKAEMDAADAKKTARQNSDRAASLAAERQRAEEERKAQEASVVELKDKSASWVQKARAAEQRCADITSRLSGLQAEVTASREAKDAVAAELATTKTELDKASLTISKNDAQVRSLTVKLVQMEQRANETEQREHAALATVAQQKEHLERLERETLQMTLLKQQLNLAQSSLEERSSQVEILQARIDVMHSDVTDKDQTSQLLHKEVNSLKTSLSAANQLSANLKKELETLNHDIVDSNEKLATASARLAERNDEVRALTDQVQKLSTELGTCKSLYEAERTTAARVGADLECAREEHSAAYQHLQQQMAKAVEAEAARGKGLEEELCTQLLEATQQRAAAEKLRDVHEEDSRSKGVMLEELQGGAEEAARRLREAQQCLETTRDQLVAAQEEAGAARVEVAQLSSQLGLVQDKAEGTGAAAQALEQQRDALRQQVETLRASNAGLVSDNADVKRQLRATEAELQAASEQLAARDDHFGQLDQSARATVSQLEAELEDARVKMASESARVEALEEEHAVYYERDREAKETIGSLQKRMRVLEREKCTAQERAAEFEGKVVASTAAESVAAASRKEAAAKLSSVTRISNRLQEDNQLLRDKFKRAEAEIEAVRKEMASKVLAQEKRTTRAEMRARDAERSLSDARSGGQRAEFEAGRLEAKMQAALDDAAEYAKLYKEAERNVALYKELATEQANQLRAGIPGFQEALTELEEMADGIKILHDQVGEDMEENLKWMHGIKAEVAFVRSSTTSTRAYLTEAVAAVEERASRAFHAKTMAERDLASFKAREEAQRPVREALEAEKAARAEAERLRARAEMQLSVGDVKVRRMAETAADMRERAAGAEAAAARAGRERDSAVAEARAMQQALQAGMVAAATEVAKQHKLDLSRTRQEVMESVVSVTAATVEGCFRTCEEQAVKIVDDTMNKAKHLESRLRTLSRKAEGSVALASEARSKRAAAARELRDLRERYFETTQLFLEQGGPGDASPRLVEHAGLQDADPTLTMVKNLGGPAGLKHQLVGFRERWQLAVAAATRDEPESTARRSFSHPKETVIEVLRMEGCILPLLADAATLVAKLAEEQARNAKLEERVRALASDVERAHATRQAAEVMAKVKTAHRRSGAASAVQMSVRAARQMLCRPRRGGGGVGESMEQVLEALNGDLQEDQRSESYEDDFENDTPVKSVPEDARSDIAGWGDHDDSQSQVSVVPTAETTHVPPIRRDSSSANPSTARPLSSTSARSAGRARTATRRTVKGEVEGWDSSRPLVDQAESGTRTMPTSAERLVNSPFARQAGGSSRQAK